MADMFNPKVIIFMILFLDVLTGSMSHPKNRRRRKIRHSNRVINPTKLFKVNNFSRTLLQLKTPTNKRTVTLLSRNGLYLEVKKNLTPGGGPNVSSRAYFELQSMATSIIRFKNIYTKRFLAINQQGELKLQRKPDHDCLFKEVKEENYFHSFASHKYYKKEKHDIFIGITKSGGIRSPRSTAPGQNAVQFLYMSAYINTNIKRKG